MTLNEIAKLTGKSKSTIWRWVESCSVMKQETYSKMEQAKITQKPANFTLDETIGIIRSGGNETLANLLKDNASKTAIERLEGLVEKLMISVNGLINRQSKQIMREESLLEPPKVRLADLPDKYSRIAESAINNKIKADQRKRLINQIWPDLNF